MHKNAPLGLVGEALSALQHPLAER